jgi:hypothetical protein
LQDECRTATEDLALRVPGTQRLGRGLENKRFNPELVVEL